MKIPADIYHAHDANALPACFLAAWLRHKPLIFDAHELPLDEPAITRWPRLHKLATRALASILSCCSGIIATSPPTAQEIEKLYHVSSVTLVRNAELLDWTASADIGLAILPLDFSVAVQNMLPNKFFEYLMAGLPVLASPLRAIAEIIEANDVGQVLNSLEPIDVAESINAILADKEGLARMRRNALIAAQQEFHWEKERTRLLGLYRDILGMRNEEAIS